MTDYFLILAAVRDYREGDKSGGSQIAGQMAILGLPVADPDLLSIAELDQTEELARTRLDRVALLREQLQRELIRHRAQQTELNNLAMAADAAYQKASFTVHGWARAYRRFPLGVKIGGFIELMKTVVGVGL